MFKLFNIVNIYKIPKIDTLESHIVDRIFIVLICIIYYVKFICKIHILVCIHFNCKSWYRIFIYLCIYVSRYGKFLDVSKCLPTAKICIFNGIKVN